jgi:hypothetical protein
MLKADCGETVNRSFSAEAEQGTGIRLLWIQALPLALSTLKGSLWAFQPPLFLVTNQYLMSFRAPMRQTVARIRHRSGDAFFAISPFAVDPGHTIAEACAPLSAAGNMAVTILYFYLRRHEIASFAFFSCAPSRSDIMKKLLLTGVTAAVLAIGGLAAASSAASAYVVCNADGDCWHTETHYTYPNAGYVYHPDDWYFHQTWDDQHHFRDYHRGRGYWRGGAWVTF